MPLLPHLGLACLKHGYSSRAAVDQGGRVYIQLCGNVGFGSGYSWYVLFLDLRDCSVLYSTILQLPFKSEWLSATIFQYFKPSIRLLKGIKGGQACL